MTPDDDEDLTDEQRRLRASAAKLKERPTTSTGAAQAVAAAPPPPRAPSFAEVHDLGVVAAALAVLAGAGLAHRALVRPETLALTLGPLAYRVPAGWLERPAPPPEGGTRRAYQAIDDPRLRLEVEDRPRPPFPGPLGPVLELAWSGRPGLLSKRVERGPRFLHGREWVRTRYAYAFTPTPGDVPALADAIELGIVSGERLLTVTLHGPPDQLPALEAELLGPVDLGDAAR